MTALLPCPFCGGEADIEQTGPKEITIRCVGVQPSGLRGCGPRYKQKVLRESLDWLQGVMVETWNRRAPVNSHEALVATLENLIGHANFVATNFDIHYAHIDEALAALSQARS